MNRWRNFVRGKRAVLIRPTNVRDVLLVPPLCKGRIGGVESVLANGPGVAIGLRSANPTYCDIHVFSFFFNRFSTLATFPLRRPVWPLR